MKTVKLFTKNDVFIVEVQIPEMHPMPDLILWEERHFLHETDEIYKEGYCVAILTEKQYKELYEPK